MNPLFDLRRPSFVLVACASATLMAPSAAIAEPTKEDVASAKGALKEGRELRAKGDLQGALTKFKAAYSLVPTPITGWDLGQTQEMLGLLLEARDTLLEVQAMPVSPKEVDEHKKARASADALAQSLKTRIPSLSITLAGNVVEGKTKVVIDGRELPLAALGAARKLNPGRHSVRVTTGTQEKLEELELKEGESKSITVTVPSEGSALKADPKPKPEPPKEPGGMPGPPNDAPRSDSGSSLKVVGFVVGGAGLVGVGVGSFLGLSAKSRYSDSAPYCRGDLCQAEGLRIREDARSKAGIATIVFGIGAAAVVGGVVLIIAAPSSDPGKVQVGLSPTGVHLMGRF